MARQSRKRQLAAYLEQRRLNESRPAAVERAEWRELVALLHPISEGYLSGLLNEAGLRVAQPFAGVRQKSLGELEDSLVEMERVYTQAIGCGDRETALHCRRVVIEARRRARFASKNAKATEDKRRLKAEMSEWMLVWLENPPVFPVWARLRRGTLSTDASPAR